MSPVQMIKQLPDLRFQTASQAHKLSQQSPAH